MSDQELIISAPSHELYLDMIATFPIEPEYSELRLFAGGVLSPQDDEEQSDQRYRRECNKQGIIPYTSLSYRHSRTKGFVPQEFNDGSQGLLDRLSHLVQGGKIHSLKFTGGFDDFKQYILPVAINNGYKIEGGNVWFTYSHLSGLNEGDYADAEIVFGTDSLRNGLELRLGGHDTTPDQKEMLRTWFIELQRRNPRPLEALPLFESTR